jgi:Subtilase family
MSESLRNLPHLSLPHHPSITSRQDYTYPKKVGDNRSSPTRNRGSHAGKLRSDLGNVFGALEQERNSSDSELDAVGEPGFYLDVEFNASEKDKVLQSLENIGSKIELMTVTASMKLDVNCYIIIKIALFLADNEESRKLGILTYLLISLKRPYLEATLFIPDNKKDYFEKKIIAYENEETKNGKPKNEPLISRIESFSLSSITSLYNDERSLFPQNQSVMTWWEIWIEKDKRANFDTITKSLNIRVQPHSIKFIEREVVLTLANVLQIGQILRKCGAIAELRIAKDMPSLFFENNELEQQAWMNDLIDRCVFDRSSNVSICLLDSGVMRSHPLLENSLSADDMHCYEPAWNNVDDSGHGTNMAGLSLYGDLCDALITQSKIKISHCLESVKMLPPTEKNDPALYGWITQECVSRAEIQAPFRKRVICMPVTSEGVNQGTPSSWSAAIDNMCFGRDENSDKLIQRLIILCVGNIRGDINHQHYIDNNDSASAENPSQSWNALVIGAFTEKVNIVDAKYTRWKPIAPAGDLSPRSRTSCIWSRQWPNRPDVVFEGGNLATNNGGIGEDLDDLSLLTVHHKVNQRLFALFGDTSAATALAGYFAAQILIENPDFWPETVRALIVHSATWTAAMRKHLPSRPQQKDKGILLRRYGYGVPSLGKALRSATNDLTMIVEDGFQPFQKKENQSNVTTKDMNLHTLPWPKKELELLGAREVEMRVTLSYFIESNPGERGWVRRYSYPSYGLRFVTKDATELLTDFQKRITKNAHEEGDTVSFKEDKGWFLGTELRNRGSLHSDIWTGTAADLAAKDAIGVYPVGGWWKDRPFHNRWSEQIRYTLIVSIRVMGEEADIYTPVATLVRQTLAIEIET